MSRTLSLIARVRGVAVVQCRRELAAALSQQDAAEAVEREAVAALARERAEASRTDAGDGAVEAFAAWLPRGNSALAGARDRLVRAQAVTTQARAGLVLARAAEAAAEALLERRAVEARAELLKREQALLDEIAQRPRPA